MDWQNISVQDYFQGRKAALTEKVRVFRTSFGLSQQDIAELLECSRSRIGHIENGIGEYSLEELELLALKFGKHPDHFMRLSGELATLQEIAFTNHQSSKILGDTIPCQLPPHTRTAEATEVIFSPDNCFLVANLAYQQEEADHQREIVCFWETKTGKLCATVLVDHYVSAIAFRLNDPVVAIGTSIGTVMIWNYRLNEIVTCLDDVDHTSAHSLIIDPAMSDRLIISLQFSEAGSDLIMVNQNSNTVTIWDTEQWQVISRWRLPKMAEGTNLNQLSQKVSITVISSSYSINGVNLFPVNTQIIVLQSHSNHLDSFFWDGEFLEGRTFREAIDCFAGKIIDKKNRKSLFAVGGVKQFCEIWYQDDSPGNLRNSYYGQTSGFIRQIVIVDEYCVLGLLENVGSDLPRWSIKNLVANQPVAFLNCGSKMFNKVKLSNEGKLVAYLNEEGVSLQEVQLEHLHTSFPLF